MPKKNHLIRQIDLSNGLTVSFYDCSEAIVGDRSQVRLLVAVPITPALSKLEGTIEDSESFRRFVEETGGCIEFQSSQTRNFISNEEVVSLLQTMTENFIKTNLTYLSHPDFPRRYVLKRFEEWLQTQAVRQAHTEAVRSFDSKN